MTEIENLQTHFRNLGFPQDAAAWLIDVWRCIQLFDDVADGGEIVRAELDAVIWACFVSMADNPFFVAKRQALIPVLAAQVLKWQGADAAERAGAVDERAYMWRAGYYDLVLMVAAIVHGPESATALSRSVMEMYGEKFADYIGEFS